MGEVTFWVLVAAGILFALLAFIMVALVVVSQLRQVKRIDALVLADAEPAIVTPDPGIAVET
ncbi:MAG: hypothetical protein LBC29_02370 [Propionibacteriaceae bacterium]|jgi:hypothetical protein|nr:hypothetical protein [Propionibacteriaceae bacterium]